MSEPVTYFDMHVWGFRTLREKIDGGWRASVKCVAYGDAQTAISTQDLSDAYVDRNLVEVGPIFDFEFAFIEPETGHWFALPKPGGPPTCRHGEAHYCGFCGPVTEEVPKR